MLGPRQEAQAELFYEFSLEDHVPQDHLLRSIDRFVDLTIIRAHFADFHRHTGRPSVDPELLIRKSARSLHRARMSAERTFQPVAAVKPSPLRPPRGHRKEGGHRTLATPATTAFKVRDTYVQSSLRSSVLPRRCKAVQVRIVSGRANAGMAQSGAPPTMLHQIDWPVPFSCGLQSSG